MPAPRGKKLSRRRFLRLAATSLAAGPFFRFPRPALASEKSLRIAKWAHFVPEFDTWFDTMAREWGDRHGTHVKVDHVPVELIHQRATIEASEGHGHDLVIFPWPPAEFIDHVIDHSDIYLSQRLKYGVIDKLAHRSTFHVKTRKYFAFCDSWLPAPLHYRSDSWGEVGMPMGPLTYGSLRSGGKRVREKLGVPCGLPLTPTLEGNITLHTILVGFGGAVMDVQGNVLIDKGARTAEALKYVKLLYDEAGDPAQLTWGPSDNVTAMLARRSSCTINAISLLRAAEKQAPETAGHIMIQPPLLGTAGAGIVGIPHVTNCSAIWKFAENSEGARQFLSDLPDSSRAAYEQSKGCNFPIFQKTLPDLILRLENDTQAAPQGKYRELKDALHWTHNLGVPGYATPAFMETFTTSILPDMFLSVVKGDASPEAATRNAAARVQRIADKWRNA
jgi:multiple sugar transport system substrate-binding protein